MTKDKISYRVRIEIDAFEYAYNEEHAKILAEEKLRKAFNGYDAGRHPLPNWYLKNAFYKVEDLDEAYFLSTISSENDKILDYFKYGINPKGFSFNDLNDLEVLRKKRELFKKKLYEERRENQEEKSEWEKQ